MVWYKDEGLARFQREWLQVHPGATIYFIGDLSHSTDPDVSQHAPDTGGSAPGDDLGEVDAADVMPGNGVTDDDLDELFAALIKSRDPRILYIIHRDKIVSSVVSPWTVRSYGGHYHGHVHISVNDKYDNNQSDWKWEPVEPTWATVSIKYPTLIKGMEDDALDGYDRIRRIQVVLNWLDPSLPDLDPDGVYGSKTAQKLAAAMRRYPDIKPTTTDGSRIGLSEYRAILGLTLA